MLPLRPNVCLLILNRERKIFVGRRAGIEDIWQLPQGGVEEGTLEENALREAHEELGVDLKLLRVLAKLTATHEYDFLRPPSYAIGKWRGQSQTFWVIEFLGSDSDIKLDRFEPEFSSFVWTELGEVLGRVEEKRRKGYEAPLREVEVLLSQRKI